MSNTFFETIKVIDGKVFNISFHQERYESVLNHFSINSAKNLQEFIKPPKIGFFRCRLVYGISKNSHTLNVTYHEYKKREINSLKLLYSDDISYGFKSTYRDKLDELYALRGECDDILIVKNSLVTDTSIANIAFFDGSRWITPASPLLRGTTRERLLREGKIFEEEIHVNDLENFSQVALMNAMIDFDIITKNAKDFCAR
ncbi:MAG: aminotransferase class IV family protein [Sulfurimonas sp.]|uniref:aminotransferase class IV family protein n=1 Tax=Sulfurimonas sp. TaxID=2022749 RepID=UPI002602C895|nr:aminotransferase class IV family protein [Sulfurimonas sp.]MDD5373755.1 aminotransferase class IV family protein [Sulfurimonas sp.]